MSEPKDFSAIVRGEQQVHVIAQDDLHLAFLAPAPVRPGHVVVITREVVDSTLDLSPQAHAKLWAFVREVGLLLRRRLPCARVCVSVIGWAVRHAHVHLLPTDAAGQVPGLAGQPLTEPDAARLVAKLTAG